MDIWKPAGARARPGRRGRPPRRSAAAGRGRAARGVSKGVAGPVRRIGAGRPGAGGAVPEPGRGPAPEPPGAPNQDADGHELRARGGQDRHRGQPEPDPEPVVPPTGAARRRRLAPPVDPRVGRHLDVARAQRGAAGGRRPEARGAPDDREPDSAARRASGSGPDGRSHLAAHAANPRRGRSPLRLGGARRAAGRSGLRREPAQQHGRRDTVHRAGRPHPAAHRRASDRRDWPRPDPRHRPEPRGAGRTGDLRSGPTAVPSRSAPGASDLWHSHRSPT